MTTNAKTGKPFPRGAKPTPRHKLLSTFPHTETVPTPPMTAYVPKQLSMWLNDTDGDCVTAEEALNKACAVPEIFITDATVQAWASEFGFLNGANLTDVMDKMSTSGFQQSGSTYGDGAYTGVDYSNEQVLQNAISIAPVKIGIDADALPTTAGSAMGWYALGGTKKFTNEDHCVGLVGYGTAAELYAALNVPLPSGLPGTTTGYLLFTWNTIGFVDYPWIMSTVAEAWLRNPTTTVNGNPIPNPGPNPTPNPTPTPTPTPAPGPTPTPTPGPTPTPSPTPSGTFTAADYDAAVAGTESANPKLAKLVIAPVAAAIRSRLIPSQGRLAGIKQDDTIKFGAASGWTPPPQLIADLDAVLTAAAAAAPQYAAQINAAKTLIDALLPLV